MEAHSQQNPKHGEQFSALVREDQPCPQGIVGNTYFQYEVQYEFLLSPEWETDDGRINGQMIGWTGRQQEDSISNKLIFIWFA